MLMRKTREGERLWDQGKPNFDKRLIETIVIIDAKIRPIGRGYVHVPS